MKPQSLKTIQSLIDTLTYDEPNKEVILEKLMNIIRIETPQAKGSKFDIFKFTCKDDLRPIMQGVFHDKGNKVASDSHILAVIKEEYDESLEGQVVMKDGSLYKYPDTQTFGCRYPNYQSIYSDKGEIVKIDFAKVTDAYNAYRANKKARVAMLEGEDIVYVNYNEGKIPFKVEMFYTFAGLMNYLGTDELRVPASNKASSINTENGWGLIFPMMQSYIKEKSVCINL